MNTYEAKRGFFTFIILLLIIGTMSVFVNFVIIQNTSSEIEADSSVITTLPQSDLIVLVGAPILILGIIITAIKRIRHKYI